MFLIFRNYFLTIIPFLAILLSNFWTIGLLGWISGEINVLTILIPTFVFVIGTSDCVHILSNYQDMLFRTASRREAIRETLRLTALPCLMTSLTTMVGFASLVVSHNVALRELGLYTAFGIGCAYVLGVTFIPILLSFLSYPHLENYMRGDNRVRSGISRFLEAAARLSLTRRRRIIAGSLAASAFFGVAAFARLHVEEDSTNYFGRDTYIKRAHDFINAHFPGTGMLYAVITDERIAGSVLDPDTLRFIDGFERHMESQAYVGKAVGIADLILYIGSRFRAGPALPETREEAQQLLMLAEDHEFVSHYLEAEQRRTVMAIYGGATSLDAVSRILAAARAYVQAAAPPGLHVELTGTVLLLHNHLAPLIDELIKSLTVAVVIITALVGLMFRSLRVALLSLVPNLLPVFFTFGAMALLDIPLNLVTSPFACVALGLAVDDTLHFLARFRIEIRKDHDYPAAVQRTLRSVGKAIVFTTLIFIGGFCIFLLSSFEVSRNFGALVSFTLFGALAADILLLPALLIVFRPFGGPREAEAWKNR